MYPGGQAWFLLAFVLLAGLLAGCDGENQSGNEPQNTEASVENGQISDTYPRVQRGEIKTVKPDTEKIILKPGSEEQGESTTERSEEVTSFKVAQNATITVLGEEAELADLKAGQRVEVAYFVQDATNKAGSVKVTEQAPVVKTAAGEIKTVKPEARKIVLKTASSEEGGSTEGETTSLKVAQNATITVLGEEAELADLKAGQQAEMEYIIQGEKNAAGSVKVTEQAPVVKTAAGEIKTVKPDRRKIILRQGETIVSLKVAQNAAITLNGQDAELTDLKAGQQAEIEYYVLNEINKATSVKIGETAAVSGPTPG